MFPPRVTAQHHAGWGSGAGQPGGLVLLEAVGASVVLALRLAARAFVQTRQSASISPSPGTVQGSPSSQGDPYLAARQQLAAVGFFQSGRASELGSEEVARAPSLL